ncbi:glycosyltransferase family 4 protein [Cetobacterium sp.]|uniref:glycosyltransferase family 4 protein n=1 Tax=Cetobacterium sp. TaxID=2071632 RepID=UPI003F3D9125
MKKIAIISPGVLPLPAIDGGAVETLVEIFLKENEKHKQYKIDTYSVESKNKFKVEKYNFKLTNNIFISKNKFDILIRKFYISQLLSLFLKIFMKYPYVFKLRQLLKNKNYDCIIVENFPEVSIILSKITKSDLILHLHNDYFSEYKKKDYNFLRKYKKIICVSEYISNQLQKEFPSLKERIETVNNCIDLTRFNLSKIKPKENESLKEKYRITKNDRVISYFGRLTQTKGIDYLIDAFSNTLKTSNNLKLMIVGSKSFNDNSKDRYTQELEKKIKKIQNNVIFTGYIDHEKIPNFYSISDIVVVPSICQEAFSLVTIESMAMKIPVIANSVGGIPYITSNKEITLIKNSGNLSFDLEEALKKEIKNRDSMKLEKAYEKVVRNYTPNIYFKNISKIIESL